MNNIFDFWILQEIFNSLPEIELHDKNGNKLNTGLVNFRFKRERSIIARSPLQAVNQIVPDVSQEGRFPLVRCYAGVIRPNDFLEVIEKILGCTVTEFKNPRTFGPLYMISFFCNPEGSHIYSSLSFDSKKISINPILISLFWFYIYYLVKDKKFPNYRDIFEIIQNCQESFINLFTDKCELVIKQWVLDTSFIMRYANLEYNPLLALQNYFNNLKLHISELVQKELEGLKHNKRQDISNRAKKAILNLEEFREYYPESLIVHSVNNEMSLKILEKKKRTGLCETDVHAILLAEELKKKVKNVLLLATDINLLSIARNEKILCSNRLPPARLFVSAKKKLISELTAKEMLEWFFEITKLKELKRESKEIKSKLEMLVCDAWIVNKNYLLQWSDDQVNTPSFFINDIEKAKELYNKRKEDFPLLKRYIEGYDQGLFLNKDTIKKILTPDSIPLARWPAPKGINPFFNQYLAVSSCVHDFLKKETNEIISVNGPPGSGKTTLLREYVANTIEKMADIVSNLVERKKLSLFKSASDEKIGEFYSGMEDLCDLGIIVASANNNAVTNVTKELPLQSKNKILYDYPHYRNILAKTDVDLKLWKMNEILASICLYNTVSKTFKLPKKRENNEKVDIPDEFKCTFCVSAVLGNKENTRNFLMSLEEEYRQNYYYKVEDGPYKHLYNAINDYRLQKKKVKELIEKIRRLNEINEFDVINIPKEIDEYKRRDGEIKKEIENTKKKIQSTKKILQKKEDEIITIEQEERLNDMQLKEVKDEYNVKISSFTSKILRYLPFIGRKIRTELSNLKERIKDLEKIRQNINKRKSNLLFEYSTVEKVLKEDTHKIDTLYQSHQEIEKSIEKLKEKLLKLEQEEFEIIRTLGGPSKEILIRSLMVEKDDVEMQRLKPYGVEQLKEEQEKLFLNSLKVLMWASLTYRSFLWKNIRILKEITIQRIEVSPDVARAIWGSFFLIFPVVSTTFHSLSSLFHSFPEKSLGTLVVDEAGQGVSYMALGGLIRCKRAIIVGDPLQLEPVVTLPEELMYVLCEKCKISKDDFVYISGMGKAYNTGRFSLDSSVQLLADRASNYKGIILLDKHNSNVKLEVGIPLRIHFRCDYSLLSISNAIAYGNTIIHFKEDPESGIIQWLSVEDHKWINGKKNVCENEIDKTINLAKRLQEKWDKKDIFIISPFKDVTSELKKRAKRQKFLPDDQIGTVHTFQGKEAPVVIFVLGGQSRGARAWATQKPNLLNVAITRAKNEFYIIGDLTKWGTLPYFETLSDYCCR